LERAAFFFDYAVNTLQEASTGRLARPLVLLLAYGFQRPTLAPRVGIAPPPAWRGAKVRFVPLRRRVVRRLLLIVVGVLATTLLLIGRWLSS
jgi:hypothetical protein